MKTTTAVTGILVGALSMMAYMTYLMVTAPTVLPERLNELPRPEQYLKPFEARLDTKLVLELRRLGVKQIHHVLSARPWGGPVSATISSANGIYTIKETSFALLYLDEALVDVTNGRVWLAVEPRGRDATARHVQALNALLREVRDAAEVRAEDKLPD